MGEVRHRRRRPRVHALRYRIFMLLLDLDELPALDRRLRLFSLDRFNLFGLRPRDHGDGSATPLRAQVERRLAQAGVGFDGGPVRLLCLPRVLGYVFNPLSLYFCHRRDGALAAIVYEVSSTFGERHSYVIPAGDLSGALVRQRADKRLHVSPFLDMDLSYAFRVAPPGERLGVIVDTCDRDGVILHASFHGERRPLTDATLIRAFCTHPLLTLKVTLGIHWEALKLIAKGLRLRGGPPAPPEGASLGRLERAGQTRRYSMVDPSGARALSAAQVPASAYQSVMTASPVMAKPLAETARPSA
ncbi:MAG: DUF1365 family protein [Caulobacteraceae bacterium]|nr:DUF1365 family protein [Caulobacter sp.]